MAFGRIEHMRDDTLKSFFFSFFFLALEPILTAIYQSNQMMMYFKKDNKVVNGT